MAVSAAIRTRPVRLQRSRTKGWRMPEGAVYVGRPTEWGNSAKAGDCGDCRWGPHDGEHRPMSQAAAVAEYRMLWEVHVQVEADIGKMTPEELRLTGVSGVQVDLFADIRGRDLACWCPLEDANGNRVPCHADVLLELANR